MTLYYYDHPSFLAEAKRPYQLTTKGPDDPDSFQEALFLAPSQMDALALPVAFSKLIPIIIDNELP